MSRFEMNEQQTQRPLIQMAPLIDIVFLTLVFFMTISVFNQMETELNINVPKTKSSQESGRSPGDIIINITQDGRYIINQRELELPALEEMLKRVAELFPNQQAIIRADEKVMHKYVMKALDACTRANIWDISFSTSPEDQK